MKLSDNDNDNLPKMLSDNDNDNLLTKLSNNDNVTSLSKSDDLPESLASQKIVLRSYTKLKILQILFSCD